MNNNVFRSVLTFWYNNKHYHMFEDENYKYAFLVLDDNNKYHYPTLKELLEVTELVMNRKEGVRALLSERITPKKYKFIPKVITSLGLVVLSTAVISTFKYNESLAKDDNYTITKNEATTNKYTSSYSNTKTSTITINEHKTDDTKVESNNTNSKTSVSTITVNEHTNENTSSSSNNTQSNNSTSTITVNEHTSDTSSTSSSSNTNSNVSTITVHNYDEDPEGYFDKYLSAADDEYDYKWANDFYYNEINHMCKMRDSKGYEHIYGYQKPTYSQLCTVIDNNKNIDAKFKPYIKQYISDWLALYPETDFSNFYYNLKTLKIVECTKNDIKWAALSSESLACYRARDNAIFVRNDLKLGDKSSNDYIVLGHELWHAARNGYYEIDNTTVIVGLYDDSKFGTYTDEALDTYFMYQLQGENNRSDYYVLASNYFRIIMDSLGDSYSGSDYMNHSINYLATKMDYVMTGTQYEGQSLYVLSLIDAEMDIHFGNNTKIDQESLQYLFDYMVTMYCKTHINEGMSASEANAVFDNFMYEVSYKLDGNFVKPYDEINEDAFRPAFESYCNNLGISLSRTK